MAERLKLYTAVRNSAGERVRIALGLKGLAYEFISVPDMEPAAYRAVNPQGLMPALDIDGEVIVQSLAILDHIERRWPQPALLPDDADLRAQSLAFGQYIAAEMHAVTISRNDRFLENDLHLDRHAVDHWLRHWNMVGLTVLEDTLARRDHNWPFCFGDAPGWADLHLVPQMRNCRRFNCDLTGFPRILAVEAACAALPAFIAAAPEKMPGF